MEHENFSQRLPAKHTWRPKKVLPSESGAPGTKPYGKSDPGYYISFIKKLHEGLRKQLLGSKSLIFRINILNSTQGFVCFAGCNSGSDFEVYRVTELIT